MADTDSREGRYNSLWRGHVDATRVCVGGGDTCVVIGTGLVDGQCV